MASRNASSADPSPPDASGRQARRLVAKRYQRAIVEPMPAAIAITGLRAGANTGVTGHYSASSEYFASSGANDGTLHALSNAKAGGNGVFVYSASAFPNLSYKATNYWVDVIVTTPGNAALSAAPAAAHLSGGNPMPLALMVLLAGALFGCTLTGRRIGRLPVKR